MRIIVPSQGSGSGFDVTAWHAMLAPAKVNPAIIMKLNQEITRIVRLKDVEDVLLQEGGDIALTKPQELAAVIREELAKWQKVVKLAAIAGDT